MGSQYYEPQAPPAPPSRGLAKVLASLIVVFVLGAVGAIGYTAMQHDVVLEGVMAGSPSADDTDQPAAKKRPRKGDKDGYSTWSERHGAATLAPADDLLKPLPEPYSYVHHAEWEQCVCQTLEAMFADVLDDVEARIVAGPSGPVAAVIALRSSERIPKRERRLSDADVANYEAVYGVPARALEVRGKPVLAVSGAAPALVHIGKDNVIAVAGARFHDGRRIMSALLAR